MGYSYLASRVGCVKSWTLTSATGCFCTGLAELPRPEDSRALCCCLEVTVLGVLCLFCARSY